MAFVAVTMFSCDNETLVVPAPTPEETISRVFTMSNIQVVRNGILDSDLTQYKDMTIRFDAISDENNFTYSVENGGDAFPNASGTWTWKDETKLDIVLDEGDEFEVDVDIAVLRVTEVRLEFTRARREISGKTDIIPLTRYTITALNITGQ